MDMESVYQERFSRIKKAIAFEPVDQVPLIQMAIAFNPRYMGMTIAKFCADPEAASQVALAAMDKLGGFDGCQMTGAAPPMALATLWLSRILQPGKELPEDSLWQVQEGEVMSQADYDAVIAQGWPAFFGAYLPRVVDMAEFGATMGWSAANGARVKQMFREHGYVQVSDGLMANIPFEAFCGGRSMQKFIFDLHRIPDKVEEAMKVMHAATLAQIAAAPPCPPDSIGGSWIGGWRSASGLIAPKLWNRFVWPYIIETAEAVLARGYTPVFHWDQDWTRDVGRLAELPAKKCILNPDGMTDVRKFRSIVGDRMALLGDVPASLFAAGTPDHIYAYVRDLVRDVGATGLLLCPGCDAPINTKPENMVAFVAAAREFGTAAVPA